jgi:hypothetical protein
MELCQPIDFCTSTCEEARESQWTRNTTKDNRNVQIDERRQLRNLCRNYASQLIGVQVPAKKHVNVNGHETPPGTIATYKRLSAVNFAICVGIVPVN